MSTLPGVVSYGIEVDTIPAESIVFYSCSRFSELSDIRFSKVFESHPNSPEPQHFSTGRGRTLPVVLAAHRPFTTPSKPPHSRHSPRR